MSHGSSSKRSYAEDPDALCSFQTILDEKDKKIYHFMLIADSNTVYAYNPIQNSTLDPLIGDFESIQSVSADSKSHQFFIADYAEKS